MESGFIFIANNIFETLLALSSDEQSHGLMYQEWPPPIMSFIYAKPDLNRFWMKNTPSPLDIVFCCEGKVRQICKGEPYSTSIIGDVTSDMVIELPYGMAKKSGIEIGNSVGLVKPTRDEVIKILASKKII